MQASASGRRRLFRRVLWFASIICFLHFGSCRAESDQKDFFFTFQVETLTSKAAAQKNVSGLEHKGYPAFISILKVRSGKKLYKIRIGRYPSREEAVRAGLRYQSREQKPFFVVQSESEGQALLKGPEKQTAPGPGPQESDSGPGAEVPRVSSENLMSDSKPYYTIQVAAERKRSLADNLARRLQGRGYPVYIVEMPTSKGVSVFKVRVGSYPTRKRAEEQARLLLKKENRTGLIVVSRIDRQQAAGARQERISAAGRRTGKAAPAAEGVPAPAGEPVSRVYAYRGPDGDLNLTGLYENIPASSRKHIEYVSIFPVRFVSADESGPRLVFEVGGERKAVSPAGVELDPAVFEQVGPEFFERYFVQQALRLKYDPNQTSGAGTICGRLYSPGGQSLNLEMIRAGLGRCRIESVDPEQKEQFMEAARTARMHKAGVWREK